MELRDYFAILQRRRAVVALLGVATLIAATVFTLRGPRSYEATIRIAVSVGGPIYGESPPYGFFRDYYLWLASEYLADDLAEIVKSDAFIADVRAQLDKDLRAAFIRDVVRARKTHRILEVTVQGAEAEQARQMATAIAEVIRTQGSKYLAQLATPTGQMVVIDDPAARPATTTGSQIADVALRTTLGLLAGVLVAFLVDYVDSTLRTASEVERFLGLPILGEIPSTPR